MRTTHLVATLTLASIILAAGAMLAPVSAQDTPTSTANQSNWLTPDQVRQTLEAQGYSDFQKIELKRDRIEVKARDAQARLLELYLHPQTGEVVKWELESDQYRQSVNPGEELDMASILNLVSSLGYADIHEIERERNKIEVKAFDQQGRLVELYLHPVTGEVLKSEIENSRYR